MGLSFYYIPRYRNTPRRVTHLNNSHKAIMWSLELKNIKKTLKKIDLNLEKLIKRNGLLFLPY